MIMRHESCKGSTCGKTNMHQIGTCEEKQKAYPDLSNNSFDTEIQNFSG